MWRDVTHSTWVYDHNAPNPSDPLVECNFYLINDYKSFWRKLDRTMDDPFVSCPYDKLHRVPLSRLQGHIVKCQKKYPELKICPYNATHRFPETKIYEHLKNCTSKAEIFPEKSKDQKVLVIRPRRISQSDFDPESDPNHEIWDD